MKPALFALLGLIAILWAAPAQAQVTPQTITINAADGLPLVATWSLVGPEQATVILLHQLYSHRGRWSPLDEALIASGYNVLAVDLRGYGETDGDIDWLKALDDIGHWSAWVRAQGVRDSISLLGSSMGSVLALVGCGRDAACKTAVAISPGWEYFGVGVGPALTEQYGPRRALLVYSLRDRYPRQGIPRMVEAAPQVVEVLAYPGNAHGMDLVRQQEEDFTAHLLDWLARYGQ